MASPQQSKHHAQWRTDQWRKRMAAEGLRASVFAVEASEEVIRRRLTPSVKPLDTPAAAFGAVCLAVDRLGRAAAITPHLAAPAMREQLLDLMATAWKAALDLEVASQGEPADRLEPGDGREDHPALDAFHSALDLKEWIVRRMDDRVEFSDPEGRRCEAIVRVLEEAEDDHEEEGEVETRPKLGDVFVKITVDSKPEPAKVQPGQKRRCPESGCVAVVRFVNKVAVRYVSFTSIGLPRMNGKIFEKTVADFLHRYPELLPDDFELPGETAKPTGLAPRQEWLSASTRARIVEFGGGLVRYQSFFRGGQAEVKPGVIHSATGEAFRRAFPDLLSPKPEVRPRQRWARLDGRVYAWVRSVGREGVTFREFNARTANDTIPVGYDGKPVVYTRSIGEFLGMFPVAMNGGDQDEPHELPAGEPETAPEGGAR